MSGGGIEVELAAKRSIYAHCWQNSSFIDLYKEKSFVDLVVVCKYFG